MAGKSITYTFTDNSTCNMCGSANHKVLGKRLSKPQGRKPWRKEGVTVTIVKCINCGLIFPNPLPVPEKISDHYDVDPAQYWHEEHFTRTDDVWINHLKKNITINPGQIALDIGSGTGQRIHSLNKAGFDTYGLEPSESFYKMAIEKGKVEQSRLQLSSLEGATYPAAFFDFIYFGAVLEHLYDPSAAINKVMEWLKPGGVMFIEVPSADWFINKLINFYYRLRGTDYVGNLSPMHTPYHLYEFGMESFRKHQKNANYEIAHYEYWVCETYMPRIADFFLKRYMKYTNTGMQLSVWLKKK
jgi:ubiquinone/menaquinone biosynthesis C-methylase UbiE